MNKNQFKFKKPSLTIMIAIAGLSFIVIYALYISYTNLNNQDQLYPGYKIAESKYNDSSSSIELVYDEGQENQTK